MSNADRYQADALYQRISKRTPPPDLDAPPPPSAGDVAQDMIEGLIGDGRRAADDRQGRQAELWTSVHGNRPTTEEHDGR